MNIVTRKEIDDWLPIEKAEVYQRIHLAYTTIMQAVELLKRCENEATDPHSGGMSKVLHADVWAFLDAYEGKK